MIIWIYREEDMECTDITKFRLPKIFLNQTEYKEFVKK